MPARLRAELKPTVDQKSAVAASLKASETEAGHLRVELESTTERVEVATRQLEEARRTADKLEAARVAIGAARDEQAAARKAAEADLEKTREAVEALRENLGGATKELERAATEQMAAEADAAEANSQSQAAEAKLEAVTDLLKKGASRLKTAEQAQQQQERTIPRSPVAAAGRARGASRDGTAMFSPVRDVLEELIAGFQALAAATTITDVFTTLVEQMAGQFPRVALFRMKKGHLLGQHQIGFDLTTDIGKIALPLGMESLPARAASSGQVERLAGKELKTSRLPFAGAPTSAIAFPLVVTGGNARHRLRRRRRRAKAQPRRGRSALCRRDAPVRRRRAVAAEQRAEGARGAAEIRRVVAARDGTDGPTRT